MMLICPFCVCPEGRVMLKASKKHKSNGLGSWYFCPCCREKFHIKLKRNGKRKVVHHPKDKIDRGKVIDCRLLEARN